MNPSELIVLILLIAIVGSLLVGRQHYAAEDRKRLGGEGGDAALRDEVLALRERVRVLERVVTDTHGSHDLDREIERLRDR